MHQDRIAAAVLEQESPQPVPLVRRRIRPRRAAPRDVGADDDEEGQRSDHGVAHEAPERLVTIWDTNLAEGHFHDPISPVNFSDQRELPVFDDAAAWATAAGLR